jgi:hypothetical protein
MNNYLIVFILIVLLFILINIFFSTKNIYENYSSASYWDTTDNSQTPGVKCSKVGSNTWSCTEQTSYGTAVLPGSWNCPYSLPFANSLNVDDPNGYSNIINAAPGNGGAAVGPEGQFVNDTICVKSSGTGWTCSSASTNASFSIFNCFQSMGPTGPAGATGPVGAIGPTGPFSPGGITGPIGPSGINPIVPIGPSGINPIYPINPITPIGPSGINPGDYDYNHYNKTKTSIIFYASDGSRAIIMRTSVSYTITIISSSGKTQVYTLNINTTTVISSSSTIDIDLDNILDKKFISNDSSSNVVIIKKNGKYYLVLTNSSGSVIIYSQNQQNINTQTTQYPPYSQELPYPIPPPQQSNDIYSNMLGFATTPTYPSANTYYNTLPTGISGSEIPPDKSDQYILKSQIVPMGPFNPGTPYVNNMNNNSSSNMNNNSSSNMNNNSSSNMDNNNSSNMNNNNNSSSTSCSCGCNKNNGGNNSENKCPPCPACARCPEPNITCKAVPNYSSYNNGLSDSNNIPMPVLDNFSSFGM